MRFILLQYSLSWEEATVSRGYCESGIITLYPLSLSLAHFPLAYLLMLAHSWFPLSRNMLSGYFTL